MGFSDKYLRALLTSDLRDDSTHHQPETLQASAHADRVARDLGSLLKRVKYADTLGRQFEDNAGNLVRLLREWESVVAEKGAARNWIRPADIPTIGHLAPAMYKRVANASLAHFLDGKCVACHGAKVGPDRRTCTICAGTGDAKITGMSDFERNRVLDMVSELISLESSHSGAANALLRSD